MRIYYKVEGGHVHCRVFTTGAKCGDLVFTVKEWPYVRSHFHAASVMFVDEAAPAMVIDHRFAKSPVGEYCLYRYIGGDTCYKTAAEHERL